MTTTQEKKIITLRVLKGGGNVVELKYDYPFFCNQTLQEDLDELFGVIKGIYGTDAEIIVFAKVEKTIAYSPLTRLTIEDLEKMFEKIKQDERTI